MPTIDSFNFVFKLTKSKEVASEIRKITRLLTDMGREVLSLSENEDEQSKERVRQLKSQMKNFSLLKRLSQQYHSGLKFRDKVATKNITAYNKELAEQKKLIEELAKAREKDLQAKYKTYQKTRSLEAKEKRQSSGTSYISSKASKKEKGELLGRKIAEQRLVEKAERESVPILAYMGLQKKNIAQSKINAIKIAEAEAQAEEDRKAEELALLEKQEKINKKKAIEDRKYVLWWENALKKQDASRAREKAREQKEAGKGEMGESLAMAKRLGKFYIAFKAISEMAKIVPQLANFSKRAISRKAQRLNMIASSGMNNKDLAASLGVNISAYGGTTEEALQFASGLTGQLGSIRYGDAGLIETLGKYGITGVHAFSKTEDIIKAVSSWAKGKDVYQQESLFNAMSMPMAMRAAIRSGDDKLMAMSAKAPHELSDTEKEQLRQLERADNSILDVLSDIAEMISPISRIYEKSVDLASKATNTVKSFSISDAWDKWQDIVSTVQLPSNSIFGAPALPSTPVLPTRMQTNWEKIRDEILSDPKNASSIGTIPESNVDNSSSTETINSYNTNIYLNDTSDALRYIPDSAIKKTEEYLMLPHSRQ